MTTTQAATNGHRNFPPPCDDATSIVIPSEHRERGIPQPANNNPQPEAIPALPSQISDPPSPNAPAAFPAGAYHVPPKLYAPKADSFRDTIPDGLSTMKLPDRCQFMFSDGRQCAMARSDIHPSLCTYHSDREEQLFGDPTCRREARALDFPELFSASRDLSSAAGVNRALAQVFRLLAQRRISRQEAATFAKLAHLLLQSIRAARLECETACGDGTDPIIPSEQGGRGISPTPPPERGVPPMPRAVPASGSPTNAGSALAGVEAPVNQIDPPPRGFVMKADPLPDSSSIFCRPTMPAMNEERFILSDCTRGEPLRPENRHVHRASSQPSRNEHLQNART